MALKSIKDDEFDPAVDEEIAETPAVKPATTNLEERLTAAIEALAARADEGPIKQVPLPKAKLRTPWNPSGKRVGRPKFARNTYMNGNMLREILHSDEEIALCNQIKAGRYANGNILVTEKYESSGKGTDEVEIRVANKTTSDKIWLAQVGKDLSSLLRLILDEAATRTT